MIAALLLPAALALEPFDPGDEGKRCASDPDGAARAASELAQLAEQVTSAPAAVGSAEHRRRLKAVRKLRKGYLCSRADALNAGLVLVTSTQTDDLDAAFRYGAEAAREGLQRSHYVAAAAFDRARIARGQDQAYGTQFGAIGGQPRACIYPIDPTMTDEQRAGWSVPPLASILTDFLAERGHAGQPPQVQTLRRLNLLCESGTW